MEQENTLKDKFGRQITYARLAVIDRCNLRCFYCMPATGIEYIPRDELLTYEEMERLITLLSHYGVDKVRITGGEPFLRRDLVPFLYRLKSLKGINQVNITTNGVFTGKYIHDLETMKLDSVNLSLDTLDKNKFFEITRRDQFDAVWHTYEELLKTSIKLKINAVLMDGTNDNEIKEMVDLAKNHSVSMRFIEEMPFNGEGKRTSQNLWNAPKILAEIKKHYPDTFQLPHSNGSTSLNYQIPGFKGNVGIIAAYSRTFCGDCNRIRITARGTLKTCLYDEGGLNLKQLMRQGDSDDALIFKIQQAILNKAKDGFAAEKRRTDSPEITESMSTIGG